MESSASAGRVAFAVLDGERDDDPNGAIGRGVVEPVSLAVSGIPAATFVATVVELKT